MSPRGTRDYAAALLAAYVAEIKRYRELWQIRQVDRETHLTAWASAKASVNPRSYP